MNSSQNTSRNFDLADNSRPWFLFIWMGLIACAIVIFRFTPHLANFLPIGALSLFAGGAFRKARVGYLIPIASMLLTDYIIGFHATMWSVYLALGAITLLGAAMAVTRANVLKLVVGSLSASTVFFIITNFGVWYSGGLYENSMSGLAKCFVMAIPFYFRGVGADLVGVFALFAAYRFVLKLSFASESERPPIFTGSGQ